MNGAHTGKNRQPDEIRQFISRVVPWPKDGEAGHINIEYQVRSGQPGKPVWTSKSVKRVDEFLAVVGQKSNDKAVTNIYYCLSQQSTAQHRSKATATFLKAIWLDLDVKLKGYATLEAAVDALFEFIRCWQLPPPSAVVLSGSGLHVYWFSDRPLTVEEWRRYAAGLKTAAQEFGLCCDAGVITDAARVLRVPGTRNFKTDPPQPVSLGALQSGDIDFATGLKALLELSSNGAGASPIGPVAKAFEGLDPRQNLGEGIAEPRDYPPLPVEPILAGCAWLREAHDTGGKDFDNPQWNLTTLTATFLADGHKLAHAFGNRHSDYDHGKTENEWERKLRERREKDIGYPSCRAIADAGAEHCAACPHFAKGKSPLNLGLRLPAELRNMLHLHGTQPVGDYPTRSHLLWAFIKVALRRNIDENAIIEACLDEAYCGCAIFEHVREQGGYEHIKQQIERAANESTVDDENRAIIKLEAGKLDKHWRAVQRELIKRNCPVYVRGNRLVQFCWRWEKVDDVRNGKETLTARFAPLFNLSNKFATIILRQFV